MTTAQPRNYPFEADRLNVDPMYARLRREEPLSRVQLPYGEPAWLATRYEDVRTVLGDRRFSRAAAVGRDQPRSRPYPAGPGALISLDPPEHSRLRRLVGQAFTMKRVERLRPSVEQFANGLVDAMTANGSPAELVQDFGLPLPIAVMCDLLGVPFEDRAEFRQWADAFLSTTKFTVEQVRESRERLRDYVSGMIAQRREAPGDDLMSAMVAARDSEDRLSEEELLTMTETILVAGHETTASQIPNFVYVLLTNPDQLAALRADLGLIPQAVEELLRYVPVGAASSQPRYALEDVELGGVTVRAGEPVVVVPLSANRDGSAFTDPDDLDLSRKEAPHLAFGHGPHHCLGSPLARMELQVGVHTLLTRLPGLRLAVREDEVVWKSGVSTRGPERLPITWDQA